jgi:hypothetical protein
MIQHFDRLRVSENVSEVRDAYRHISDLAKSAEGNTSKGTALRFEKFYDDA